MNELHHTGCQDMGAHPPRVPRVCETMQNIPAGIMRCLRDGGCTLLEANDDFLRLIGYTWEELQGRFGGRFLELVAPPDRARFRDAMRAAGNGVAALECRLLRGDGSTCWALGRCRADAHGTLTCLMIDFAEQRDAREELRLSIDRRGLLSEQTSDIIFEWDMIADSLHFSPNWEKKLGYDPITDRISERLPRSARICAEDMPILAGLMRDARQGRPYSTADFRIQDAHGHDLWFRARMTNQFDEEGRPIRAVGVLTDIDEQKRLIDSLRRRAERDALTGLYNRQQTESLIEDHLRACSPDEMGALLMIDTDNFKTVNDTFGHLFGDAVLTEMAAGLRKQTRSTDVVGRIGGDEFTVFLKGITDEGSALRKAEQMLAMFGRLFEGEKRPFVLTCSIGIALYPRHGRNFLSLYHCADRALYQAKSRGKNQLALYEPQTELPQESESMLGAAIDSDLHAGENASDLAQYIFRILYSSADLDQAIGLILKIVGKRFDVSRAYIFENSEDGRSTSNTYEWCAEGIASEKDSLQGLPIEALGNYEGCLNAEDIFYCRDIRQLEPAQAELLARQGIRSVLQCIFRENGAFRGFVGFDECSGLRLWTREEVAALSLVSRLLSTFLVKERARERVERANRRLRGILDAQDALVYVVAEESCRLLYLNRRIRELRPGAQEGQLCREAFGLEKEDCAHCPVRRPEASDREHYSAQGRSWVSVRAVPLEWDGQGAYLVFCFDVTRYKAPWD